MTYRYDHMHLRTRDVKKTAEYYRDTFGAKIVESIQSDGRPRTVAVLGEAGIGKTRLLSELAAEAARRGARVVVGRAYESEQVLPLGPWVDALRAARLETDALLLESLGSASRSEVRAWAAKLPNSPRPLARKGPAQGCSGRAR